MRKSIGLFFGTFNPIHVGHLILANYMVEYSNLDEVWLVVTPHNPHKKKSSLLNDYHRYDMVWEMCEDFPSLRPSNIEFDLPQPNYTVNTLAHLEEKYPDYEFTLIMGEDNLKGFPKWKNYEIILERHAIAVYPRFSTGEVASALIDHPKIKRIDAPRIELSSTFIRQAIKEGKNVRPMLPVRVWDYIEKNSFYKS